MHASFELNPRLLSQVGVMDRTAVAVKGAECRGMPGGGRRTGQVEEGLVETGIHLLNSPVFRRSTVPA